MNKNIGKIGAILLYVVFYVTAYLMVAMVGMMFMQQFPFLQGWIGAFAMLFAGGAVFLLLPDKKELVKVPQKPVFISLCVIFLALGVSVGMNFLMGMIPWEQIEGANVTQDNEAMFGIPFYVRILAYVVVAPLSEEILFRGIIFRKTKEFIPLWGAILISALAFALYHGNLQQGLYAFVCGVILAWVYHVSDSFWMPVLFHASANLIVNLAFEFTAVQKVVYSVPALAVLAVLAVLSAFLLNSASSRTLEK